MTTPDLREALIAGGGPAGSVLAITLAKAGRDVVLVEKSSGPHHKICGEFLSPETVPLFAAVGIDLKALGAKPIRRVRFATRGVIAEVPLPHPALSLTRKTLDEALLDRAQAAGVDVRRGTSLEHLTHQSHPSYQSHQSHAGGLAHWHGTLITNGQACDPILAREAFLATGKHDLRGWTRTKARTQSNLIAMKMYFALAPDQQDELADHVELVTYPGGYTGLQPVEGGWANLCALITRDRFQTLGNRWENLLDHMEQHSPHLAKRLCDAKPQLDRPLALSAIPYGYRAPSLDEGPWRLGDQAAVIPSFCGEGMAIALYTAQRAAEFYIAGANASAFQAEMRRELGRSVCFAALLSRALVAAPSIAHALRIAPSMLRMIFAATRLPGTLPQPTMSAGKFPVDVEGGETAQAVFSQRKRPSLPPIDTTASGNLL
ncbi:MAG TPA: NAD(P)/FAD-dependent oxidoreductase [Acidobacteriaceae bacterium]|jgi:flavin-dependent dehydrogenase